MSPIQLFIIVLSPTLFAGMVLLWLWLRARQRHALLQAELSASEARHRQMISVADIAMVMLNETCHVVDWTPAMGRLCGCSLEQAKDQQFFLRFSPPDEGNTLTARAMAMRSSDEMFSFTYAISTENGSPRIIHWRARFSTSPIDDRRYLSMVANDVTALETALTELASSEVRLRQVFESVPASLSLIDPEGRLRMVNNACAAFFGFDAPEQMVALNLAELIHPDDRKNSMSGLMALQARPESLCRMETRFLRQDESIYWGEARSVLLELSPGQKFFLIKISDIHERKEMEQKLKESERRLETLMANLSGIVYRYELPDASKSFYHDTKPLFLSDGVELMTGFLSEKFLEESDGKTIGHFIAEDDRNKMAAAMKAARAGDGRFSFHYRLYYGEAKVESRWVVEQGLIWQRPNGVWSVDGYIMDTTTEKQALDAAQVYRSLVSDTHTGFLCLAENGHIMEVNQPYCDMFELAKPEQVQGRLLEDIFPSHKTVIRGFIEVVMREGGVHDAELVYKMPSGKIVTAMTSAIAIQESGQRIIKCLLVDVSRTRRIERERQEIEQRYRTMFETSTVAISFISLDGRIEDANPALYRMFGMKPEEGGLTGLSMYDLAASLWKESDDRAKEQLLMRGWCDPYRKELKRKDGSTIAISIQSWLVNDGDGQPQRVMSMATDISDLCHLVLDSDMTKASLKKLEVDGRI